VVEILLTHVTPLLYVGLVVLTEPHVTQTDMMEVETRVEPGIGKGCEIQREHGRQWGAVIQRGNEALRGIG
jgi:hypothetical protein